MTKKSSDEYRKRAREIDEKKKSHLLKTFVKQGKRGPFRVPIGQMVHISPKTCNKLGLDKEMFQ